MPLGATGLTLSELRSRLESSQHKESVDAEFLEQVRIFQQWREQPWRERRNAMLKVARQFGARRKMDGKLRGPRDVADDL